MLFKTNKYHTKKLQLLLKDKIQLSKFKDLLALLNDS